MGYMACRNPSSNPVPVFIHRRDEAFCIKYQIRRAGSTEYLCEIIPQVCQSTSPKNDDIPINLSFSGSRSLTPCWILSDQGCYCQMASTKWSQPSWRHLLLVPFFVTGWCIFPPFTLVLKTLLSYTVMHLLHFTGMQFQNWILVTINLEGQEVNFKESAWACSTICKDFYF